MNFFIVVDMFIAVSFFGTDVSALRVKRLAQIASKYVPMAYNDVPKIWLDSQHGNAIIHWIRNGEPENDRFTIDKKGTFVIDGYTTNILRNKTQADSALAKLSVKNKYLKMDESTGGVAAFAWATPRGDLFAWSTQPAAHGIYCIQGR